MKLFQSITCLFLLPIAMAFSTFADEWDRLNPEQLRFCTEQMEPALALYRAGDHQAALDRIEQAYQLAEQQFPDTVFFYRIVWWEAQIRTGQDDEEWAIEIYRYLFDRNHRIKPESAINIPDTDYVLYGNISEMLRDVGKSAEARALIMQLEDSQRDYRGMDTACTPYADLGPLFSFLSDARKRAFPIYNTDLPASVSCCRSHQHFIYYTYIYGIRYAAEAALDCGDWVRAAELNHWFIRYTDEYMKGKNSMSGEVRRCSLDVCRRLAQICLMHGYPDEAASIYENFIEKAEGYYLAPDREIYDAKLELALIRIQQGMATEDMAGIAETADRLISEFKYYSRWSTVDVKLRKARVYHALGRTEEAWALVNTLLKESLKDVNPYYRIRMLTTAIDLALLDGATDARLEEWLVLTLQHERSMGNKFGELPLYEKYAAFLTAHGRYDEAEAILQEAIRLSRAINLPRRIESNQAMLTALRPGNETRIAETPPADRAVAPEPPAETAINQIPTDEPVRGGTASPGSAPVDIQPAQSLTTALQGLAAHGRFHLYNPTSKPQRGTLQLRGNIDQVEWQNDGWLTLGASPAFPPAELSKELVLAAGESCIIDMIGLPAEDGSGGSIECKWIDASQATAMGTWVYRESTTSKRTAVIDAHEVRSNPFYLVPLHHMIQRRDAGQAESVDFAVSASSPMRIEAYDEANGKLIYIDANGDGDFKDQGDLIASDANRNTWPDIRFGANRNLASLALYVKPAMGLEAGQELTIKLLDNGSWRIDAIDVIK